MTTRSGAGSSPGKPQQAREQASKVGHEAAQSGGHVAREAAGQGKQVATEARRQARNLAGEVSEQLRQQAGMQQKRAAEGLRALGSELQSMASKSDQDGVAGEMVRRVSGAAEQAAGWLEGREPGDLVNEVRDYARRRPGVFLAGAVVAGLLMGRLTRDVASADGHQESDQGDGHREPHGMPLEAPSRLEPTLGQETGMLRVPGSGVTR
jgi:hypothetical protein